MTAAELFADDAMAAGYASARPPVHPHLVDRLRAGWDRRAPAVIVDVGCGAGASTAALRGWAPTLVGMDPSVPMIRAARACVPDTGFAVAAAEALPGAAASVDLLAATGSLDYADLGVFVHEADRVLRPDGVIAVANYGFGRPVAPEPQPDWPARFASRFGRPASRPVTASSFGASPFAVVEDARFVVTLAMTRDAYLAYVMTDTGVARAVAAGTAVDDARAWCADALPARPDPTWAIAFDCSLLVLARAW